MARRAIVAAVLCVAASALVPSVASQSAHAQGVTPMCNGGSCDPWFTTDVTLEWNWNPDGESQTQGCGTSTFTSDVRHSTSCMVRWGTPPNHTDVTRGVEVKIDKTPPTITSARPERTPDKDGWYTAPVHFVFGGSDVLSGIATCGPVDYAGPDGRDVAVNGGCRDVAGNVSQATVFLDYDASAPAIRAVPERPPDSNGWYTSPVRIVFEGADPVSGVESCTAARYEGPDSGFATVRGSCTDRAGNVSTHTAPLSYDATRPSLELTRVLVTKRSARLDWSASPDVTQAVVTRARGSNAPALVSRGSGTSFTDAGARRRLEYRYRVRVADAAGHVTAKTVAVVPGVGPVLRSGEHAGVTRPPLLRWRTIRRADYYNVQLHRLPGPPTGEAAPTRAGRKIASSWPLSPRFRLRRSWRYGGREQKLAPGYYEWYAWPGFGRKGAGRYGPLAGMGSFRVVRR